MQAQKRFAQLVLPVAIALPAFASQLAAADPPTAAQTPTIVNQGAAPGVTTSAAAVAPSAGVMTPPANVTTQPAGMPPAPTDASAGSAAIASQPTGTKDGKDAKSTNFGVAMSTDQLDEHRGGDALISNMNLTGSVESNVASHVATGSNMIDGGSFANSSGLPTVIQNTGANVLIQNATILNVRFGD